MDELDALVDAEASSSEGSPEEGYGSTEGDRQDINAALDDASPVDDEDVRPEEPQADDAASAAPTQTTTDGDGGDVDALDALVNAEASSDEESTEESSEEADADGDGEGAEAADEEVTLSLIHI